MSKKRPLPPVTSAWIFELANRSLVAAPQYETTHDGHCNFGVPGFSTIYLLAHSSTLSETEAKRIDNAWWVNATRAAEAEYKSERSHLVATKYDFDNALAHMSPFFALQFHAADEEIRRLSCSIDRPEVVCKRVWKRSVEEIRVSDIPALWRPELIVEVTEDRPREEATATGATPPISMKEVRTGETTPVSGEQRAGEEIALVSRLEPMQGEDSSMSIEEPPTKKRKRSPALEKHRAKERAKEKSFVESAKKSAKEPAKEKKTFIESAKEQAKENANIESAKKSAEIKTKGVRPPLSTKKMAKKVPLVTVEEVMMEELRPVSKKKGAKGKDTSISDESSPVSKKKSPKRKRREAKAKVATSLEVLAERAAARQVEKDVYAQHAAGLKARGQKRVRMRLASPLPLKSNETLLVDTVATTIFPAELTRKKQPLYAVFQPPSFALVTQKHIIPFHIHATGSKSTPLPPRGTPTLQAGSSPSSRPFVAHLVGSKDQIPLPLYAPVLATKQVKRFGRKAPSTSANVPSPIATVISLIISPSGSSVYATRSAIKDPRAAPGASRSSISSSSKIVLPSVTPRSNDKALSPLPAYLPDQAREKDHSSPARTSPSSSRDPLLAPQTTPSDPGHRWLPSPRSTLSAPFVEVEERSEIQFSTPSPSFSTRNSTSVGSRQPSSIGTPFTRSFIPPDETPTYLLNHRRSTDSSTATGSPPHAPYIFGTPNGIPDRRHKFSGLTSIDSSVNENFDTSDEEDSESSVDSTSEEDQDYDSDSRSSLGSGSDVDEDSDEESAGDETDSEEGVDDDELQRLSEELRRPVDRKDALVIKSFAAVRNLVWKSGGANVDIQPLGRDCKGKAIVIKSTGERIVHQCNAPMAIENGDAVTGVYFAGDGVVGYRLRFGTNCFRCQQWHSAQRRLNKTPFDILKSLTDGVVGRAAILDGPEMNIEKFTRSRLVENKRRFITSALENIGKGSFPGSDLLTTEPKDDAYLQAKFDQLVAEKVRCPMTGEEFDMSFSSHRQPSLDRTCFDESGKSFEYSHPSQRVRWIMWGHNAAKSNALPDAWERTEATFDLSQDDARRAKLLIAKSDLLHSDTAPNLDRIQSFTLQAIDTELSHLDSLPEHGTLLWEDGPRNLKMKASQQQSRKDYGHVGDVAAKMIMKDGVWQSRINLDAWRSEGGAQQFLRDCHGFDMILGRRFRVGDYWMIVTFDRIIDSGPYEESNVLVICLALNLLKATMSCFKTEAAFAKHREEFYSDFAGLTKKAITGVIMRGAALGYAPGRVHKFDEGERDAVRVGIVG